MTEPLFFNDEALGELTRQKLAQNLPKVAGCVALLIATTLCEPLDWGVTIYGWTQGDFAYADLLGFLPLVSSQVMNKVDDAVGVVVKVVRGGDGYVDEVAEGVGIGVRNAAEGAAKTTGEVVGDARKFWANATEFNGVKVYQRNDIIDPNLIDDVGRTNLQRIQKGLAPIGPDGKSINLHHMTQTNDSAIAEVTQSFHQQNKKVIHINPNTIPSGIDRGQFNIWKSNYWKDRTNDSK